MTDKKNIILAFGNKEFNNSLIEIQEYLSFNLKIIDNLKDDISLENYQGMIIHEDALKDNKFNDLIDSLGNRMDLFTDEMMIIISKEIHK